MIGAATANTKTAEARGSVEMSTKTKQQKNKTDDVIITLPEAVTNAPEGIVFCSSCGVIRRVVKTITERCDYDGGHWLNLDTIDVTKFDPDIQQHRDTIVKHLGQWDLQVPSNVDITLYQANATQDKQTRNNLLMKAHVKADTYYYKMWGDDKIEAKHKKGPPMSEEVKEILKARRERHPEIVNIEPLMKVSLKSVRHADVHGLRQLYWDVYGAEAGANLTADNMRRSLEYAIKELISTGKRAANSDDDVPPPQSTKKANTNMPDETESKQPSKPKKVPLYENQQAQAEREAKYPWCVKGSWRQDPEHESGTLVDIKCQECSSIRTVHTADLFQVRLCVKCRDSKKVKKNGVDVDATPSNGADPSPANEGH